MGNESNSPPVTVKTIIFEVNIIINLYNIQNLKKVNKYNLNKKNKDKDEKIK